MVNDLFLGATYAGNARLCHDFLSILSHTVLVTAGRVKILVLTLREVWVGVCQPF